MENKGITGILLLLAVVMIGVIAANWVSPKLTAAV